MYERLTQKKKRLADALIAGCRVPGDLSTTDIKAAARIAGYNHPRSAFRYIEPGGKVKCEAMRRYIQGKLEGEKPRDYEGLDLDGPEINLQRLREFRDDPDAPPHLRVRACEMLLKAYGADRPQEEVEELDAESAALHLRIMLGLDEEANARHKALIERYEAETGNVAPDPHNIKGVEIV